MNFWDILVLALVGAAVVFAVLAALRRRKAGRSCCGCCENCPSACSKKKE